MVPDTESGSAHWRRGQAKRARTRARLIDAAAQLVFEKGFERTSLDDIAQRVGMSRGAIYGNFKDRDELFLAMVEARWTPVAPAFKPGASFGEQMRILAEALISVIPARRAAAVGASSFQTYALTHAAMRRRLIEMNGDYYRRCAETLLGFVPEDQLPMPAERLIRVLHGMTDGLLALHFLTPELIGEEVIYSAFELLGAGGMALRPRIES